MCSQCGPKHSVCQQVMVDQVPPVHPALEQPSPMRHTRSALPCVRSNLLARFRLRGNIHAQQRSVILSHAPYKIFGSSAASMIMHSASHFKTYSSGHMQFQARQCVGQLFNLNQRRLSRSKRCETVVELQNALANAAADMATVLEESSRQAFS